MHQIHKFILSWNSTCFGEFFCPSSEVYSLYTQQKYMSYRFVDRTAFPSWSCSKAVHKPVWHIPLLSVQWINSLWWTDEVSETCRVSWQNKFVKLVHLVGFITKKFVMMHGHMDGKFVIYCQGTVAQWEEFHQNATVRHVQITTACLLHRCLHFIVIHFVLFTTIYVYSQPPI